MARPCPARRRPASSPSPPSEVAGAPCCHGDALLSLPTRLDAQESVQTFGRKKTAVAVSYCKKGRGLVKINGCPIELIEPEILRYKVFEPILLLGRDKFANMDIRIRVKGGGYTSQIYGTHPPSPPPAPAPPARAPVPPRVCGSRRSCCCAPSLQCGVAGYRSMPPPCSIYRASML